MFSALLQPFEPECIIRILISAACGFLIGIEREKRAKSAGIRTHILVAISSALMMAVSKYGFCDVIIMDGVSVDPSRIAAGVVTAIGFLGAGVIFVRKENTVGLTTAAGLWATVGMGITVGAGLYTTGITFTIFILIIQFILHSRFLYSGTAASAELAMKLPEKEISMDMVTHALCKKGLKVRNAQIEVTESSTVFSCRLLFSSRTDVSDLADRIRTSGCGGTITKLRIKY